MERTGLGELSWVGRVRLLDDLPTRGDTSSDLLGLVPQARSLAGSLLRNAGRPMVLHIDGAWGRGKTSFCRMLETQLFELQEELARRLGVKQSNISRFEQRAYRGFTIETLSRLFGELGVKLSLEPLRRQKAG